MKKEFLKMAGVKNEKDFYELFPTENHFFELYPDAKKMVKMMHGGKTPMPKGGMVPTSLNTFNPSYSAYPFQTSGISYKQMGGEEMSQQQQQSAGGEEQIINFVAQSLMQGEDPKKILEALVSQMGLQQEQAVQLIQAIAQKIKEQSGQQQQAQQQMMKYGGYSGTYDAGSGSYFKKGGSASPQEGEVYDMDEEQIQRLINLGYKIKYM